MRDLARTELDRIDALKPGQGMLEALAFARGDLEAGMFGGAIDYGHRVSARVSVFGQGEAGYQYGHQSGFGYKALVGVRGTF